MTKEQLCRNWGLALKEWTVPSWILESASQSPWKLTPEKFAPSSERNSSITAIKIRELLASVNENEPRSLLDVGCGAGGVSLLFANEVDQIIGVDASVQMLEALSNTYANLPDKRAKLKLYRGEWQSLEDHIEQASVVVCANVLYNVAEPCSFIEKLNRSASHAVVIEVHEKHPHYIANAAWKHFWNIERPNEPTAENLAEIIKSFGYNPHSLSYLRDVPRTRSIDDDLVGSMLQRICLDRSRMDEMREFLLDHPVERLSTRLFWWQK